MVLAAGVAGADTSSAASTLITLVIAVLSVPTIASLLRALFVYLNPDTRLQAQLSKDLAIHELLPDSAEKTAFAGDIEETLRKLRARRAASGERRSDRYQLISLGVSLAVIALGIATIALSPGLREVAIQAVNKLSPDWVALIGVVVGAVPVIVTGALRLRLRVKARQESDDS
ncbi:hypothetical protein [Frigoribacterium sp. 9N]|uniref:hypothetical protein n=1 Tax=Frigoribacterium sp. 9N TaxID=2653144 RepID=UPI00135B4659|nr:hypothetical protein [Frigoribacterium sp. 9N]